MIDYYYFIPDFFKWYSAHEIAQMKAYQPGASSAQIQKVTAQVQGYAGECTKTLYLTQCIPTWKYCPWDYWFR